MAAKGTLYIISAPSGCGKTSLVGALLEQHDNVQLSISFTTRAPRDGEKDGENYFFIDEDEFSNLQQQGKFLEYAKVFDSWYGTSKQAVEDKLAKGIDVILEIDWQGARSIKEQFDCVSIFILPPSLEALNKRLVSRDKDSREVIEARMSKAQAEMSHYLEYDYIIINDNFDVALADLSSIIRSQRLNNTHQRERHAQFFQSLVD